MDNFCIRTCISHNHGIIVAGDTAQIFTYEFSTDEDNSYKFIKRIGEEEVKDAKIQIGNVTSIALNKEDEELFFLMDNNQLMKTSVVLDKALFEEQKALVESG